MYLRIESNREIIVLVDHLTWVLSVEIFLFGLSISKFDYSYVYYYIATVIHYVSITSNFVTLE